MKWMKTLIAFLQETLGPDYEIVYYRLNSDNTGVLSECVEHARILQRPGQRMPQEITAMLEDGSLAPGKFRTALTTVYNDEKVANTGLLCVEDTAAGERGVLAVSLFENKYYEMAQELLYMSNLDTKLDISFSLIAGLKNKDQCIRVDTDLASEKDAVSVLDNATAFVDEVVRRQVGPKGDDPSRFNPTLRRAIIAELEANGVFTVKGMVSAVAERLFCSEVSVYRYLSDIRK